MFTQKTDKSFHSFFGNSQNLVTTCLSVDERLNKLWYIHTMKYFSAVKSNTLLIHTATWLDLQRIMLGPKVNPKELYQV